MAKPYSEIKNNISSQQSLFEVKNSSDVRSTSANNNTFHLQNNMIGVSINHQIYTAIASPKYIVCQSLVKNQLASNSKVPIKIAPKSEDSVNNNASLISSLSFQGLSPQLKNSKKALNPLPPLLSPQVKKTVSNIPNKIVNLIPVVSMPNNHISLHSLTSLNAAMKSPLRKISVRTSSASFIRSSSSSQEMLNERVQNFNTYKTTLSSTLSSWDVAQNQMSFSSTGILFSSNETYKNKTPFVVNPSVVRQIKFTSSSPSSLAPPTTTSSSSTAHLAGTMSLSRSLPPLSTIVPPTRRSLASRTSISPIILNYASLSLSSPSRNFLSSSSTLNSKVHFLRLTPSTSVPSAHSSKLCYNSNANGTNSPISPGVRRNYKSTNATATISFPTVNSLCSAPPINLAILSEKHASVKEIKDGANTSNNLVIKVPVSTDFGSKLKVLSPLRYFSTPYSPKAATTTPSSTVTTTTVCISSQSTLKKENYLCLDTSSKSRMAPSNTLYSVLDFKDPSTSRSRKPCNCTKSQCLKLYCECFAFGEFCSDCNCDNCYNKIEHDNERKKAIKGLLDRNPFAFHPKIGKGRHGEYQRRHNKGCNCKRSGCLKNYCECYEAKIMCSTLCRCIGCKNYEENVERKTLMHLVEAADLKANEMNAFGRHGGIMPFMSEEMFLPEAKRIKQDLTTHDILSPSTSNKASHFLCLKDETVANAIQAMLSLTNLSASGGSDSNNNDFFQECAITKEFGRRAHRKEDKDKEK